jgi:hypothetical protein
LYINFSFRRRTIYSRKFGKAFPQARAKTENKNRFVIISNRNLHSALFRLQRVSYPVRNLIQFPTFWFVRVMWAKPDFESITHVTGKDVQMNVKYFLPRRLAVRKADIHAFTLDPAITQRPGKTPRNAKHLRAFFLVQLRKVTGMPVGNYKRMSGVDGLMIQKSRAAIVLINHADLKLA